MPSQLAGALRVVADELQARRPIEVSVAFHEALEGLPRDALGLAADRLLPQVQVKHCGAQRPAATARAQADTAVSHGATPKVAERFRCTHSGLSQCIRVHFASTEQRSIDKTLCSHSRVAGLLPLQLRRLLFCKPVPRENAAWKSPTHAQGCCCCCWNAAAVGGQGAQTCAR